MTYLRTSLISHVYLSSRTNYPNTPVIRVTPDDLLQCVDSPGSGSSVDSPGTPRRRFILRSSKNRNTDLTRRFSETQVNSTTPSPSFNLCLTP